MILLRPSGILWYGRFIILWDDSWLCLKSLREWFRSCPLPVSKQYLRQHHKVKQCTCVTDNYSSCHFILVRKNWTATLDNVFYLTPHYLLRSLIYPNSLVRSILLIIYTPKTTAKTWYRIFPSPTKFVWI